MKLRKHDQNPILSPNPANGWESLAVCNPGAYYDGGLVRLLYRAAGDDREHKIHFGLAESPDGFRFTRVSDRPVFSPSADGYDAGCVEDARITKMGDFYHVTYAFRPFPPGRYWEKPGYMPEMPFKDVPDLPKFIRENLTMSGLLLSKDLRTFHRAGALTSPLDDDRDVILFPEKVSGRFVMLQRPQQWVGPRYGCDRPSIWIAFGDDLLNWTERRLLATSVFDWEKKKVGGSTPPLRTKAGWLVLYHGVDEKNIYRTGAMLLDLQDPRRVVARCPHPILEPEHDYETKGVMNCGVVFPTGNVVIGDTLFVYYGGADKYIGVATAPLGELVDYVSRFKA
ncbi:MAG: glycosidase [Elusimicrobiota bacterium]